ncbi:putative microtubule associated protein [Erysiphe necator]|uniref:Putative microtubule associated protein n=1 Tax=Uncinula necator TaxID=52586 RepID=A0A0B1P6U3_UNCNE|nr:putative microtubule associated protein [Erysiphe necator]
MQQSDSTDGAIAVDEPHKDEEDVDDSRLQNGVRRDEINQISSEFPANGSQLYNIEHCDLGSDTILMPLDETEMQRHLNDVESSFMPVLSPVLVDGKKGVDDTYLFDKLPPLPEGSSADDKESILGSFDLDTSSQLLSQADKSLEESAEPTSLLETTSSSPAEAAAARNIPRTTSVIKRPISCYVESVNSMDESSCMNINSQDRGIEKDTKKELEVADSANKRKIPQENNSSPNLNIPTGVETSNKRPILVHKRSSQRSHLLRNHCTSQNSLLSSLDGSEATLEADYALQSGGAMPAVGFSRHSSTTLSRSMSLGSMASGFEDSAEDSSRVKNVNLITLKEERRKSSEQVSPPETPRPPKRDLSAPTDTVIARHVRNVHVPDAVVKEYKSKNEIETPGGRLGATDPTISRIGKNLTLKEQSSTIERLSKENFDLKLKVMFLSDRLDKLSEEGVKDMISENVELKTGLAVMQRDNKALRRKVKELEKKLKAEEDRPSTSHSSTTNEESPKWHDEESSYEREEEIIYLREKIQEYVTEIEKLKSDAASKEKDRRDLAEIIRQIGERRSHDVEAHDEIDIWKDLFEQETSRCERINDENKRLHEENARLKSESAANSGAPGLNHTTNIYNITKKRQISPIRPKSGISDKWDDRNCSFSVESTLVDDLKRESEHLRQENANLRREVGAQTSMLTSRNREKERLYQEIEELKLSQRKSSAVIDSIAERSNSRSNQRSISRASGVTRLTNLDDAEREELESKNAELRDGINSLKIQNQDLHRELESCMEDFETAVYQKRKIEKTVMNMREALDAAENEIMNLQDERNNAVITFEAYKEEAQQEILSISRELDEANAEIERLQIEVTDTSENFNSLQNEMRDMSQALVRLEDDHEFNTRRIGGLEKELEEANRELEQLEKSLVEANEKSSRLTVQLESCQGEIVFLREEQESDKIKIGNLEAALKTAERTSDDERERFKDLSQRFSSERSQREALAAKEKKESQQHINQLNRELTSAREEAKRLRRKDVEAAEWKQKLVDLEEQLRTALGEIDGTRSSFLQSIAKLHHELEDTVHDLDRAKESLAQKDRIIKERDELLENQALEARKLADILDKERQYHRNTKHQFETYQKSSLHAIRNISQQESRVVELEGARQQDRSKIINLENQLKEQMTERNQLLLTLWKRLSDLCGPDWIHDNSLINGRALPSLESLTTMLPGFSRNILAAVKNIELLFKDFTTRIISVEKDLWKEYQALESNLEARTKKLDYLEILVRSIFPKTKQTIGDMKSNPTGSEIQFGNFQDENINSAITFFPISKSGDKSRITMKHSYSTSSSILGNNNDQVYRPPSSVSNNEKEPRSDITIKGGSSSSYPGYYEPKWAIRLFQLEGKYKSEREARIMDRTAARQRLDEKNQENQELVQEIERLKSSIQMTQK